MALVPYKPNSAYYPRDYPGNTMLTRYTPRPTMALAMAPRSSGYLRPRSSINRRRSKWSITNTRTNPVYPRPEVKFLDTQLGTPAAPLAITNAGSAIQSLNTLTIGANNGNRLGNQVAMKSVYYQFVINFGGTQDPIVVRHLLIWDKQSNGAAAALADVLQFSAVGVVSPLNLSNRERFVVLSDDRVTLSPQGENIRFISDFRRINQKSTFTSTTATIPTTGNLFFFMVSDEPLGATAPTYYGTWRVRYIDN